MGLSLFSISSLGSLGTTKHIPKRLPASLGILFFASLYASFSPLLTKSIVLLGLDFPPTPQVIFLASQLKSCLPVLNYKSHLPEYFLPCFPFLSELYSSRAMSSFNHTAAAKELSIARSLYSH